VIRHSRPIAILGGAMLLWTWTSVDPARAASDATSATLTVTAGSLSITVPASKALGSVATGTATVSSQLGTVTVTDLRGQYLGTWTTTVSVQSGDFTTGGGTAPETISKARVDYWSGAATSTSGTATFTAGQANAGAKVTLSSSKTAFSATSIIGNNSAAWNPTVIINVPSAAVAGVYSGTVIHSVA
jgi:hypothetical protein